MRKSILLKCKVLVDYVDLDIFKEVWQYHTYIAYKDRISDLLQIRKYFMEYVMV